MSSFPISASPSTDIWRKPPSKDIFNAPYTKTSTGPLSSFRSATITIPSSASAYTQQYDQSGLLLTFSRSSPASSSHWNPPQTSTTTSPEKWIKAGIELYNSVPRLSVVSCDRWADWSVTPLSSDPSDPGWTTISIEREGDHNGVGLWVYQVLEGGKRKEPVREICWVYGDGDGGIGGIGGEADRELGAGWEVSVSAMAARPAKEDQEKGALGELTVEVKGFEVKWA